MNSPKKKGERHLDTPTVTRSYRSKQKMRIQEIFDVHKMLEILDPDDNEYEVVIRAAAMMDAVNRRSGAYGDPPFPAPIDFVEHLFGHTGGEDEPVWSSQEERERSTLMLRCISKLSDFIQETMPETINGLNLACPMCGDDSIDIIIGPKPVMVDGEVVAEGKPGIISMTILCSCEPFRMEDVDKIEEAVSKVLES